MSEVATSESSNNSLPAQIFLTARPKMDMGSFMNSLDWANKIAVTIDGVEYEMSWGQKRFQVQPGLHQVTVRIRNLLYNPQKPLVGLNVRLQPGQVAYLRYTSGFLAFQSGILELDPEHSVPTVVSARAPSSQGGRLCTGCNQPIPEIAVFCPVCGQKQMPASGLHCSQCGNVQAEGKFCKRCGGRLV